MSTERRNSAQTDDKTLEPEQTSNSETPKFHSSIRSSQEEKPRKDDAEGDVAQGPPGIVAPEGDQEKQTATTSEQAPTDPNIVDWDENDPDNPQNWTTKKKWGNMAIVSSITFLTPLASSMVAPGVQLIMRDFHSTNQTIGSFVVSIYVLGYAVGPLFLAPMSEVYGRMPMYHSCNIMFTIWTVACALAPNMGSLLAFRLFAGIAGSCPITIGGGSIADVFDQKSRGAAMALFALGPLLGPVIGPVAGGYLAQAKGWRWVFWVLTIAGGVFTVAALVLLRETYGPVLLERKANTLRKETGNQDLRSKLHSGLSKKDYFIRAIVRPSKMLFLSPTVCLFAIYMAIVYGYLYLLFTTLSLVFEVSYGFSQGSVGLTFLGIGVGSLLGLALFGSLSDRLIQILAKRHGGEMKPEYRLPPLIPGSMFIPIGLFWYGWSARAHVHWIMPIIGTGWVGMGLIATFMCIQTYLVDCFTTYAASAIAAVTVLRSLVGAFLPLAGPKMYAKLGLGWGNSLLGFIALAMVPMTWMFYKYGERIRKHPRFQIQL